MRNKPLHFRTITYRIRSHREAVKALSEIAVADLRKLGIPLDFESVELVLTEVLTNALLYGNLEVPQNMRESPQVDDFWALVARREQDEEFGNRAVTLQLEFSEGKVVGTVEDEGQGFDWRALKAGLDKGGLPGTFSHHGRGIFIVRSKVIDLCWNEKGNRITFTIKNATEKEDFDETQRKKDQGHLHC